MILDIIRIGASKLVEGVALWQGYTEASDDDADKEPLDDGDVFQGLGLTSMPYPADDDGYAEGVCARGSGARDVVWLGARDTRTAAAVGNLKAGDTCLHSTGPQQAAQIQCKEDKRQALMATKASNGKSMLVLLDGTNDKFQVSLGGMVIDMSAKDKTMTLSNGAGASIMMQGNTIALNGNVITGGTNAASGLVSEKKFAIEMVKISASLASNSPPPTPYTYIPGAAAAPNISAQG